MTAIALQIGFYGKSDKWSDRAFASNEFGVNPLEIAQAEVLLHNPRPKGWVARLKIFRDNAPVASAALNDNGKLVLESMQGVDHSEPQRFFDNALEFSSYVLENLK